MDAKKSVRKAANAAKHCLSARLCVIVVQHVEIQVKNMMTHSYSTSKLECMLQFSVILLLCFSCGPFFNCFAQSFAFHVGIITANSHSLTYASPILYLVCNWLKCSKSCIYFTYVYYRRRVL